MGSVPCPHCDRSVAAAEAPEQCESCGGSWVVAGRYAIEGFLGKGGVAQVYAARCLETGEPVAVKVVPLSGRADWNEVELFERSARVLEGLDHPLLPDVRCAERDEAGRLWLVRDRFDGGTLEQRVEANCTLSEAQFRGMLEELLGLLEYLHGRIPPVIHRDIKPQNIMFRGEDDWEPVLVDFDAVAVPKGELSGLARVGTLGYSPPEQFAANPVPASDLYALGATMVFVASHTEPNALPRTSGRMDLEQALAGVDADVRRVLTKMTEPSLERRYASAREALDDLAGGAQGAWRADPSRAGPRRELLAIALVALLGLASLVGALMFASSASEEAPTPVASTPKDPLPNPIPGSEPPAEPSAAVETDGEPAPGSGDPVGRSVQVLHPGISRRTVPNMLWVASDGSQSLFIGVGSEALVVASGKVLEGLSQLYADNVSISPDGRRYAFYAKKGTGHVLVVDGQEVTGGFDYGTEVVFSPDSGRYLAAAPSRKKPVVVVDGVEVGQYDEVRRPTFSQNGKRYGFSAERDGEDLLVIDGGEVGAYEAVARLALSPDGSSYAAVAKKDDGWHAIHDGREIGPWRTLFEPVFSRSGARFGFVAERRVEAEEVRRGTKIKRKVDRAFVVVDGEELGPYTSAHGLLLRGSEGYVFRAKIGQSYHVVVDGEPGEPFDGVGELTATDQDLCYEVRLGKQAFLVSGGKRHGPFEVSMDPVLDPGGRRVAYAARWQGKHYAVVGARKLGPFDRAPDFAFAPDSGRVGVLGRSDDEATIHVDGREVGRAKYAADLVLGPGSRLAYWIQERGMWRPVVDSKPSDVSGHTRFLKFSPDGDHVVLHTARSGVYTVVFDGRVVGKHAKVSNVGITPDGRACWLALEGDQHEGADLLLVSSQ